MGSNRGIPDGDDRLTADLRAKVRAELDKLRQLAQRVSVEEVRQGEWFAKLLRFSMDPYAQEVDAAYFAALYPGMSPEEAIRARIELASRYASFGGALTAGAYTGAVAAIFGSRGTALPVALPTAGASFVLDLLFTSSLQLRLAYDIAVICRVPLDLDDPEDLWRLIQVAFVIKERATRWEVWGKGAPAVVQATLSRMFTGDPAAAERSLPALGKLLLQRNLAKFAIPGVGVPLSIGVNYWSASAAGRQASTVFRREARIMETARRVTERDVDPAELLWVLWLIVRADAVVHEHERLLLKHVSALVGDLDSELSALSHLDSTIDFDLRPSSSIFTFKSRDTEALYQAGVAAAAVDGSIEVTELSRLRKIAEHCSVPFDAAAVRRLAAVEAKGS
jgi:hypothetical protein